MAAPQSERETTTPFLLRLFYKNQSFHSLTDFDPNGRLPHQQLQIYTWPSCTLRELSTLLTTALPNLLEKPYAGTRIAFRLIYPDLNGTYRPGDRARFLSRELGSVVIGARTNDDTDVEDSDVTEALKQLDGDPDKTLGDARFVIGDYVACAILPPLADGTVQPTPASLPTGPRGPPPRDNYGGRRRGDHSNGYGDREGYGGRDFRDRGDFGGGPRGGGRGGGRYDDHGGGYSRGGARGGGGRYEDRYGGTAVPQGEWRRGEAPPDRERDWEREREPPGFWRGGGDSGGRGGGRGRSRARW